MCIVYVSSKKYLIDMKKMILTMMVAAITLNAFATQHKKQFTLRLMAENAADDKAYVNFDFGYSRDYIAVEDAAKVQGTAQGIPVVYTLSSNNIACATNNFGEFTQDEQIEVGVNVDADGAYTFSIQGMGNFNPSSVIILEDRTASTATILNNTTYSTFVTAAENETGRFILHITQPAEYTLTNSNCVNQNGIIEIASSPQVTWTSVSLLDSNNNLVQSLTNVSSNFTFTGLSGGAYAIQYNSGSQFSATEMVLVESGAVSATIDNVNTTVAVNQETQFTATVKNATDYEWIVNDGSVIRGIVNPYYTFNKKGDYTVILIASNDFGCQASDTASFSVQEPTGITKATKEEINIWASNSRVTVNIPQANINEGVVRVYNMLGTEIYTRPVSSSITEINLDVPSSYYIVSVENNNMKRTQKVYLGTN